MIFTILFYRCLDHTDVLTVENHHMIPEESGDETTTFVNEGPEGNKHTKIHLLILSAGVTAVGLTTIVINMATGTSLSVDFRAK